MRQTILIALGILLSIEVYAQDAYHTGIVSYLETNYSISNPSYPIGNTEAAIANALYIYGAASKTAQSVTGMDFTVSDKIVVNTPGQNQWDVGYALVSTSAVSSGDLVLMTFWARRLTTDADAYVFIEDGSTFDKTVYGQELSLSQVLKERSSLGLSKESTS